MKNLKLSVFILLVCLSFLNIRAQYYGVPVYSYFASVSFAGGDLSRLIGLKNINIIYDYSNLTVAEKTEENYMREQEGEYTDNPEKFATFKKNWYGCRKGLCEPRFALYFNSVGAKSKISGKNYSVDGAITLKIKTLSMTPGFNILLSRQPAFINVDCIFMDKDSTIIASYSLKNISGIEGPAFHLDPGPRLADCYGKAAKMMMKDINRRVKKYKNG